MSKSLPPEPASARLARRFVTDALVARGQDTFSEVAEVLVSELVTNAILHARTDFTVDLVVSDDVVRISVTDASPAAVTRRHFSETATTGRGLALIEALAADWGSDRSTAGKTVWFELREPVAA